jgi:hypothetical protein
MEIILPLVSRMFNMRTSTSYLDLSLENPMKVNDAALRITPNVEPLNRVRCVLYNATRCRSVSFCLEVTPTHPEHA